MQSFEENQRSVLTQNRTAGESAAFADQARALPGVLEARESLREVSRTISAREGAPIDAVEKFLERTGSAVQRLVVMEEYVVAGALYYDDNSHALDPLQEGHANGMIHHCGGRRSQDRDERASFFEALGFDRDGCRDFASTGAIEELASHVTRAVRSNRSIMTVLGAALRSQGHSGAWERVVRLIEDAIRQSGGRDEVVLDTLAQKFFGLHAWQQLPQEQSRKIEALVALLSEEAVNAAWERAARAGRAGNPLAVLLDIYEHGGTLYSVSGEGMQCRWDTSSGAAVWVPDKDAEDNIRSNALRALGIGEVRWFGAVGSEDDPIHARYSLDGGASWEGRFESWADANAGLFAAGGAKPGRETLEAALRREAERYCRGVLEEFNAWINGEVYIVQAKVFDRRTGEEVIERGEVCGGYIGTSYAEESLEETMLSIATQLGAKAN